MALLEVGRVVKAHGLRGELVVTFTSNRPERAQVGNRFARSADGDDDTLTIESIRPFKTMHLIHFAGIADRESAEHLRGQRLYAEAIEDPEALFVHQLIGAEVFDATGERKGVVTAIEANPASDLLVVDGATYVPSRFIVEHAPGRVVVDVPEGIFE